MFHCVQKGRKEDEERLRRGRSSRRRRTTMVDEFILDGGNVLFAVDLKADVLSLLCESDEAPDVDNKTDKGTSLNLLHVDPGVAHLDGVSGLDKVKIACSRFFFFLRSAPWGLGRRGQRTGRVGGRDAR